MLKNNYVFQIPAQTSKKLTITSNWDYSFALIPIYGSTVGLFGAVRFVGGYATASRCKILSLTESPYLWDIAMAPDGDSNKTFTITNNGDSGLGLLLISFHPSATYALS